MSEPLKKKQQVKAIDKGTKQPIEPKTTLYVNNLADGLGSDRLRSNLYLLFSIYGEVIKISVNTKKQRGQAFITMRTIDEANLALISLNNESFFSKPLHIEYSKKDTLAI